METRSFRRKSFLFPVVVLMALALAMTVQVGNNPAVEAQAQEYDDYESHTDVNCFYNEQAQGFYALGRGTFAAVATGINDATLQDMVDYELVGTCSLPICFLVHTSSRPIYAEVNPGPFGRWTEIHGDSFNWIRKIVTRCRNPEEGILGFSATAVVGGDTNGNGSMVDELWKALADMGISDPEVLRAFRNAGY